MHSQTRRGFLASLGAIVLAPSLLRAERGGPHPTPRTWASSARIATDAQLATKKEAIPTFVQAREIPAILDGIRCQCACTDGKAYYSLLSCFELPDMMAVDCQVCQAQARLAHRLHGAGKTLVEIRAGIDAKFG